MRGVQRKSFLKNTAFFSSFLISDFCNYFYSKNNGLTITTMTDDNDEAFLNYYVMVACVDHHPLV